jgi:protocatechuate 3,4-dioxygenase beta subunit
VAALAKGVAVNGFVNRLLLGVVVLAAAAAIGFGFGEPTTSTAGPPPEKAMPAKAAEKKDAPAAKPENKKQNRTITGKVIDPDGKPVADVEIIHRPIDGAATIAGKTAADGTFTVTVPLREPGSHLFPRVAGFATDEYLMPATNTAAEKTFKLIKDTPIRGRLIDTQGKPVAGASVTVRHLSGYGDTMDGFLTAWQKRPVDAHAPQSNWFVSFRSWDNRKPADAGDMFAAVTDKDGRFTIAHLGSERLVNLHIRGSGIAEAAVAIILRAGFDPTPYNRETLEKLKSRYSELGYHPMLYPPDTAVVAEAEKPIRGVVKETATGKPQAGVTVKFGDPRDHRAPALTATTDANGRYEIHGAKKTNEYELSIKRDPKTGMIGRTVKLRDTPAYEPIVADIGVAKGIVLTGRLLDDQTGDPVAGYVCVGVLVDNESAKVHPEFDSPDCYDFADAKENGIYRTVVPPGPVLLMAGIRPTGVGKGPTESRYQQLKTDAAYPQYFDKELTGFRSPGNSTTIMQGQWCKVLKLKPDETELTFDIRFKRASRFMVKVQDADGKPLTGAIAAGNTARDWAVPETCEKDTCLVYELDTAKPRFVAFLDPKHKLVGTLTLEGDEKEPATATLGPAGRVKGKLVDQAGQPIANAVVILSYEHRAADEINRRVNGDWRSSEPKTETNSAGEFEIDVVIPGEKFAVYGRKKDRFLEPPERAKKFTLKAGETKDLDRVTVKDE